MKKRIEVDLTGQTVRAFEGERTVFEFICFTGDGMSQTDKGRFHITWKDQSHVSGTYGGPMPFAMFFTGDGKAIHGGLYVPIRSVAMRAGLGKLDRFIPDKLVKIGSHGCVNLRYEEAKQLFEWAPEGTPVIVK